MADNATPAGPPSGAAPSRGPDTGQAKSRRRQRFLLFGGLILAAAVLGGGYWFLNRNSETTDDAFIEADVVSVAARLDGPVVAVHFVDNQHVDKDTVLVEIDPTDYQVALDSANAQLANALAQQRAAQNDLDLTRITAAANLEQARHALDEAQHQVGVARQQADAQEADSARYGSDVKRYSDLVKTDDASRQRFEQAEADARGSEARARAARQSVTASEAQAAQAQARLQDATAVPQRIAMKEAALATADAQVQIAQAAVKQAGLNLSYTKILAPMSGRVTKRSVEPGDVIQRGQALTNLVVDPPWVVANFKETQLGRMRPGAPVRIGIDAYPSLSLKGHVESIQPGSGSRFTLLPPENATGNFVKVVQRVPVKIVFDQLDAATMRLLAPGMSADPDVDVGATPAPVQVGSSQ